MSTPFLYVVRETILTAENKLAFIKQTLEPVFTDVVLALIVLLFGIIVSRIVGKFIQTILHGFELNKTLKQRLNVQMRLEQFFGTTITYVLYFITLVLVLDILQLTGIIAYLAGVILITIIAMSILLSIKDFLPNFMAGLLLQRRKRARIGAHIQFRGIKGKIIQRTLLETRVETEKGDIFNIPNSLFMKEVMIKFKAKALPQQQKIQH